MLLDEKRARLPDRPGVYRFLDAKGKVLYIGKAKNLRKRVSNYFNKGTSLDGKTARMMAKAHDLDWTLTHTEQEALLLENNLIKSTQPPYNLDLKDGKSFPFICIKAERFPRVFYTRKRIEDGSTYYGPFPHFPAMKGLLDFIRSQFKLRTCTYHLSEANIEAGKFRPCLEYHIKKCKAPCVGWQTEAEYNADIEQVKHLLRGHYGAALEFLKTEMAAAAERLDFERAAELKHRYEQIQQHKRKATVVSEKLTALEVLTLAREDAHAAVHHFKLERGTIVATHALDVRTKHEETDAEILEAALSRLAAQDAAFHRVVLTNVEIAADALEDFQLETPKIGDKRKLVDLSLKNARELVREKADIARMNYHVTKTQKLLDQMQADLRLAKPPHHLECFDNSNIQGSYAVSACVVFRDGKPCKSEYRHFKVRTVDGPDDFATMKEVVRRRYQRLLNEGQPLPDVVLIDGGKGQLSHALEALEELGIASKITTIGIAKRLEEIYYKNDPVPLYLDKTSPTLRVLQQARNEAHRFGITFHRQQRSRANLRTQLTDIPGIGPKTAQFLLKELGSVKRIREAAPDLLEELVGPAKAGALRAFFDEEAPPLADDVSPTDRSVA